MVREYGTKRSAKTRQRAPHQFLVVIVAYLLGYLTSTVFDVDALSSKLNNLTLLHPDAKAVASAPAAPQQAAIPPKPKFEFYTLLANDKVQHSQPVSSTQQAVAVSSADIQTAAIKTSVALVKEVPVKALAQNMQTAQGGKGTYSVQVASFKGRPDAEHMKGSLILKGFNANVISVTHANKGTWFRVVVGPYPNRNTAQQIQVTLARNERLHGMVTANG